MTGKPTGFALGSMRPLVRYVDESQAVVDVYFELVAQQDAGEALPVNTRIDVEIEMSSSDGSVFQHRARATLERMRGMVRFEMRQPQRWWPMGMGQQCLYDLTVMLVAEDELVEIWQSTLGLTSVRMPGASEADREATLLVNGQQRTIQTCIAVEPTDEQSVLPVAGDALLVVKDHFGPDVLYDAADRAGVLLVQSIPLLGSLPDTQVQLHQQVGRLANHPSLAGWLVDRRDPAAERMTRQLRDMDPTRQILGHLPEQG